MTPIVNHIMWKIHAAAERKARQSGACWLCAAEVGMRATDGPGEKRERIEMHPECQKRAKAVLS